MVKQCTAIPDDCIDLLKEVCFTFYPDMYASTALHLLSYIIYFAFIARDINGLLLSMFKDKSIS